MHKMDCKNCVHGKKMLPGTYATKTGTLVMNGKNNITCTTNVKELTMSSEEMLCSDFEERIQVEGNVD